MPALKYFLLMDNTKFKSWSVFYFMYLTTYFIAKGAVLGRYFNNGEGIHLNDGDKLAVRDIVF